MFLIISLALGRNAPEMRPRATIRCKEELYNFNFRAWCTFAPACSASAVGPYTPRTMCSICPGLRYVTFMQLSIRDVALVRRPRLCSRHGSSATSHLTKLIHDRPPPPPLPIFLQPSPQENTKDARAKYMSTWPPLFVKRMHRQEANLTLCRRRRKPQSKKTRRRKGSNIKHMPKTWLNRPDANTPQRQYNTICTGRASLTFSIGGEAARQLACLL